MEHSSKEHHHKPHRRSAYPPQVRWISLEITDGGNMVPPELDTIDTHPGDWVVWIIRNASSDKLKLTLKDFKHKKSGVSAMPVEWFDAGHVNIDSGKTGAIGGTVVYEPKDDGMTFKYTVGVSGPGSKDYDPDLEVTPPN